MLFEQKRRSPGMGFTVGCLLGPLGFVIASLLGAERPSLDALALERQREQKRRMHNRDTLVRFHQR
jgi:hypothetical protein